MFNSYFALTVRKLCKELLAFNIIIYGSLIFMVYWLHRTIYDPSWDAFVSALISTFATKVTLWKWNCHSNVLLISSCPFFLSRNKFHKTTYGALTFSKI